MELFKTSDGSYSARHEVLGDMYHSERGAYGEAMHVYIESALKYFLSRSDKDHIKVFDMGFGTALNSILTLENVLSNIKVDYITVEKYPLSVTEALKFNHSNSVYFRKIVEAPWNVMSDISSNFRLLKYDEDVICFDFNKVYDIDIVYWDAFSPDTQPELWSQDIFSKIYCSMSDNGVLTTYSAKGVVKQSLRSSGFEVKRLQGALGKHHMLRAEKKEISPLC